MTKRAEFDYESWASSIECGVPPKGELAARPDIEDVCRKLLVLRAKGKTGFSIAQLHEMLQAEYGLKMSTSDSLRTSIKKRLPDLYKHAF